MIIVVVLNQRIVNKMVCKANNCINNADGYCMCSSYVRINSDGKCDLIELHNNNFNFDEIAIV